MIASSAPKGSSSSSTRVDHSAGDRHALAHAARQLGRAHLLELGQAEALEQGDGAAARLGAVDALALEGEGRVGERVAPGSRSRWGM